VYYQEVTVSVESSDSVAADPQRLGLDLFQEGFNCSESVLRALNETCQLGLPEAAYGVATPFGAGMSGAKDTCGALTGGLMGLGLALGRSKAAAPAKPATTAGKELYDCFVAEFKSASCQELTCRFAWDQPERRVACQAYVTFCAGAAKAILDRAKQS
jgi:C_GCAxxG_C_C family probable redox protein